MNKAVTFVISLLVLSTLIESKPNPRHRYKMLDSSSSESNEDEVSSCTNCNITKIGNGYKNHNEIYYGKYDDQQANKREKLNKV